MKLEQTTPPTAEPVSLVEAKAHLRVDASADNVLITQLIRAARSQAEAFLARQLVVATYQWKLDGFPAVFEVPRPPLISVSSITYVDTNGDTQTVTASDYVVETTGDVGRIREAYNTTWPTTRADFNSVTVNFVSGYAVPFTAVAGTDVLTWGRTPVASEAVRVVCTDGDLPAPLAVLTDYYVRDVSGSTCKLALTDGGSAIDITDAGTGTHFVGAIPEDITAAIKLLIGDMYEHREAQADAQLYWNRTAQRLLYPHRIMRGM